MNVFSCGEEIFEPLEKIDQRFKLEDMYKEDYELTSSKKYKGSMKKNVNLVMEALEGEVQLKPRQANITAFKHSLMNKEYTNVTVITR